MPPFFKFIAVVVIWAMASIITIVQLVVNDGAGFNWIFALGLFGIAAGVTATILNDGDQSKKRPMIEVSNDGEKSSAKRKNSERALDPLSLLTPEDLEDLRQDIKTRLRERILSGEDGELSSLDALLTDQHKRK